MTSAVWNFSKTDLCDIIPALLIREADDSDIPMILEIEKESFSDPRDERIFREVLVSGEKHLLVAGSRGEVNGFIVLEKAADEAGITDLAVKKSMRGRGIGSDLLRAAIKTAADEGSKSLILELRASNKAAEKLYSKFGFERIGVRKGYYQRSGEDALVFKLSI